MEDRHARRSLRRWSLSSSRRSVMAPSSYWFQICKPWKCVHVHYIWIMMGVCTLNAKCDMRIIYQLNLIDTNKISLYAINIYNIHVWTMCIYDIHMSHSVYWHSLLENSNESKDPNWQHPGFWHTHLEQKGMGTITSPHCCKRARAPLSE